jgi:hypothetical protein
MAGFLFRLETVDGEPAEPATLSNACRIGSRGMRFSRAAGRSGSAVRDEDADQPPVLVVEEA